MSNDNTAKTRYRVRHVNGYIGPSFFMERSAHLFCIGRTDLRVCAEPEGASDAGLLRQFAATLRDIVLPEVDSAFAKAVVASVRETLAQQAEYLDDKATEIEGEKEAA